MTTTDLFARYHRAVRTYASVPQPQLRKYAATQLEAARGSAVQMLQSLCDPTTNCRVAAGFHHVTPEDYATVVLQEWIRATGATFSPSTWPAVVVVHVPLTDTEPQPDVRLPAQWVVASINRMFALARAARSANSLLPAFVAGWLRKDAPDELADVNDAEAEDLWFRLSELRCDELAVLVVDAAGSDEYQSRMSRLFTALTSIISRQVVLLRAAY